MIKPLDAELALELADKLAMIPVDAAPRSGRKRAAFMRDHREHLIGLLHLIARAEGTNIIPTPRRA